MRVISVFLSILIFLLISLQGTSQEIVDESKLWSCMEEHCQPWGSTYSTDYFQFEEDTIIDGFVYKKVWISEDETYQNWNFYSAFIREEDNKVYYKHMFGEEGLIYDFNLNIGDSVTINNPRAAGEITLVLEEVDSVFTETGYHERWQLKNNSYPNSEYWIRGIGSETGVLNSSTGVFGGLCGLYTLLCLKESDELVYLNPDYETCYLYVSVEENDGENASPVIVFDNVSKEVHIKLKDNTSNSVLIADISGKVIKQFDKANEIVRYNMATNPTGLYIVVVISNGKPATGKFFSY